MPNFDVTVIATTGDKGKEFELGATIISTDSRQKAGPIAIEELWDPRLDAADCTPRVEVRISPFDRFQRFVLDNYEDGEASFVTTRKDLRQHGDGLVEFLTIELSEAAGCMDANEAVRRLLVVERQVAQLRYAFSRSFVEQSPGGRGLNVRISETASEAEPHISIHGISAGKSTNL